MLFAKESPLVAFGLLESCERGASCDNVRGTRRSQVCMMLHASGVRSRLRGSYAKMKPIIRFVRYTYSVECGAWTASFAA